MSRKGLACLALAGALGGGSFAAAGASAMTDAPTDAPAQQTTPVAGSVIAAPEPVLASNGRNELAYELQLINRSESTKVEALAGSKVVEKLSGKSLERVMQPYGQSTTSDELAPGEAGFVLMDVSLARKAKVPVELTHRIVISMKPKPAVPSGLSYELAPTKVTRGEAIVIPERFAIDFSQLSAGFSYLEGPESQLSSYPSFGAEVHSTTARKVIEVHDGMSEVPGGTIPKVALPSKKAAATRS